MRDSLPMPIETTGQRLRRARQALQRALFWPLSELRVRQEVRRRLKAIEQSGGYVEQDEDGGAKLVLDVRELYRDVPRNEDGSPAPYTRMVACQRRAYTETLRGYRPRYGGGGKAITWSTPVEEGLGKLQGVTGTPTLGGLPATEHREELRPFEARGFSTNIGVFRKMADHPVIADGLKTTTDLLAGGQVYCGVPQLDKGMARAVGVDPDSDELRDRLQMIADWCSAQLFANPHVRASQMLREQIMGNMIDGFAIHEAAVDVSADRWMLTALEYREPASIEEWYYEAGVPVGFAQVNTGNTSEAGLDRLLAVDLRHCVHSVNRPIGHNPEGTSDLRGAYEFHKAARTFLRTSLEHRLRFGRGFPIFRTKQGHTDSPEDRTRKALARKFFASAQAYMDLPGHIDLELLQMDAETATVTTLEYFDAMFRRSTGTQWMELGQGSTGSWALATVQLQTYLKRLGSRIESMRSAFDQIIRILVDARFGPQLVYPELRIDGVLQQSPADILDAYQRNAEIEATGAYSDPENNRRRERLGIGPIEAEEETGEPPRQPLNGALAAAAKDILISLGAGDITAAGARGLLTRIGFDRDAVDEMLADSSTGGSSAQSETSEGDQQEAAEPSRTTPESQPPTSPESRSRAAVADLPEKYAHIDFDVPEGAREEARRGLRWREEYGRGGTEVGVARANQIADNAPMAPDVWRRTRSYLLRSLGDGESVGEGWDKDDDGGPSALRIAIALWGGEPMLSAAERVVRQMDAADEAAPRSCCPAHARKAGANRLVSQDRNGETIRFYRRFTPWEEHCAFGAIMRSLDASEQEAADRIERVSRRHRDAFVEQARPLIAEGDTEALARLTVSFGPEYEEVLQDILYSRAREAQEDWIAEVQSQIGEGAPDATEIALLLPPLSALEDVIGAEAAEAARAIDENFQRRLRQTAKTAAKGGLIAGLLSLTTVAAGIVSTVRESVTTTTVAVRAQASETFQSNPEARELLVIEREQYSAVMDGDTCGEVGDGTKRCADLDGKIHVVGSAEWEATRPPNPRCDGAKAASRGNPCRCFNIPIVKDTPAERALTLIEQRHGLDAYMRSLAES